MLRLRRLIVASAIPVSLAISLAVGQPVPQPNALSGPKVEAQESFTIIERGFDGFVKIAEPTPEEAALSLLTLNTDEKDKVGAILGKRSRIVDDFVTNNIDLLTELGVAAGTNDKQDQMNLLLDAAAKLRPLLLMGPLQDSIRECLTDPNAKVFDRVLKDYWDAFVKPKIKIVKEDGKLPNRFEVVSGAKIESVGKEVERSFQRLLMSGQYVYDLLFKGIAFTPEQKDKAHLLLERYMRESKGDANDQQNSQLFFSILPLLTEDQRTLFLRNLGKLIAATKPPKQAKPVTKYDPPADAALTVDKMDEMK